ncbi:MAG: DUF2325 domain-containing protein [Planctomycetes bacterium]|nr:DUF2325 domain-containing protein [Planctomycetota bacterium]
MSALIVGGDHLGAIPKQLKKVGIDRVRHIDGRNRSVIKKGMPVSMDIIIVLHDYVNHNLVTVIKRSAREREIPIIFARRSWSSIYKKLPQSVLQN